MNSGAGRLIKFMPGGFVRSELSHGYSPLCRDYLADCESNGPVPTGRVDTGASIQRNRVANFESWISIDRSLLR